LLLKNEESIQVNPKVSLRISVFDFGNIFAFTGRFIQQLPAGKISNLEQRHQWLLL
jgi:hypothetical protein